MYLACPSVASCWTTPQLSHTTQFKTSSKQNNTKRCLSYMYTIPNCHLLAITFQANTMCIRGKFTHLVKYRFWQAKLLQVTNGQHCTRTDSPEATEFCKVSISHVSYKTAKKSSHLGNIQQRDKSKCNLRFHFSLQMTQVCITQPVA